jgi:hypothetical protein
MNVRAVRRPRRYVAKHWLLLLRPLFAYNFTRDAYVMRGVGLRFGPVLREDRRSHNERNARPRPGRPERRLAQGGEGVDSRRTSLA